MNIHVVRLNGDLLDDLAVERNAPTAGLHDSAEEAIEMSSAATEAPTTPVKS